MKLIECLEIESDKSIEQILLELKEITNKKVNYFNFFNSNEKFLFKGKISDTYFKLKKITYVRGTTEAYVKGNIYSNNNKTIVNLIIKPNLFTIAFNFVLVLIFALYIIIFYAFTGFSIPILIIIASFFVLITIIVITFKSYFNERKLLKEKIFEIIKNNN